MSEMWKPVVGYENIYEVSNLGNVRSVDGKVTHSVLHGKRVWRGRVMRQKHNANRHGRTDAKITLWKDKTPHDYLVARLVAFAWCAGYEEGYTVNHINGNYHDNRAENLEWVSIGNNIRHAFETGLNTCAKKVSLIDKQSGARRDFASMAKASKWLSKNNGYLSGQIKRGHGIYDAENREYEYAPF